MGNVSIVVGAQWGDEGKGKWIDILADNADIVARYQGGNNAGHTLYIKGQKYVLHQIPSGVFHPGRVAAMAAGVVINPGELVAEINKLLPSVHVTPENLWISPRAHVITPWNIFLDHERENRASDPIGTTKRGIGPTYGEKANRAGLRMGQFINPDARQMWLREKLAQEPGFKSFYEQHPKVWSDFAEVAATLAPYVCDSETKIRQGARAGKNILLEGAQGTLLDLDHGNYPYVTSSSTTAAGACTSLGLPTKTITHVYGIAKAYVTKVGSGPLPTELHDETGALIARRGNEFGATTGRPRRCGWYDAVAMRYAQSINGFDHLLVNKMDILTGIPLLKIAVAYKHPRLGILKDFPWDNTVLKECQPVYEEFPGWTDEIPKQGFSKDLPPNARRFLAAMEEHTGCRILMVGTGPGREEFIKLG